MDPVKYPADSARRLIAQLRFHLDDHEKINGDRLLVIGDDYVDSLDRQLVALEELEKLTGPDRRRTQSST